MNQQLSVKIDRKEMWKSILTGICAFVDRGHLLTIFVNSAVLSFENGVLVIGFASIIGPSYAKEKYHAKIFEVAKILFPELNEIRYEMSSAIANDDFVDKLSLEVFMSVVGVERKIRKVPNKQEVIMDQGLRSKILNKRYTLQNFIPGDENRLVHAACLAVAAKPAGIYNPLYIYGGVGLGKTHLLQATGLDISKNYPSKRIVYMTAEHFINKIVEAIGKKHTKPFKEEYRNLDCLIVDDIQFFANKMTSEQEFFHTFNDLYDNGKQIILSADKPPKDLQGFDERLKSRFAMGMLIEIAKPSFETRLAILRDKCRDYQAMIDPEVLEFIAFNMTSSVREMIGVLTTALGEAQLSGETMNMRSVARLIKQVARVDVDFNVLNTKKAIVKNADQLIECVAEYFKVLKSDLIGQNRKKELMMPRQIAMFLIREAFDTSYDGIGELFGGRNHTTVMHACGKISGKLKTDNILRRNVAGLKMELGFHN